uniref:Cation-transporting ATPase n=1 Tax=Xenopus tropicalis TaxID=8364 RepID=F7CCU3_XENTR
MTESYSVLNQGQENELELFGYKTVWWRQALCVVGHIISLGFLQLLFYWRPELDVWCRCAPCRLMEADVVLIRTTDEHREYSKRKVLEISPCTGGSKPVHQIVTEKNSIISKLITEPEGRMRYMEVQKIRYAWNTVEGKFQRIGVLDEELSCLDIYSKFGSGLSPEDREIRQRVCGPNSIEVKIKPVWVLLFKEIFNPFYVFQAYSICLWLSNNYVEYACAILAMTLVSVAATIYNLRAQSVKLHKMSISFNSIMVTVLHKNGELKEVEAQSLVPGDVIVLAETNRSLPCDAILISGGCTVNEGMLTGESVPVTKIPLPCSEGSVPWKTQSGDDYKKHVLFCGSELIQTKAQSQELVKAVVLQTGFNTTKGDLLKSILYNKSINVKLHRQAMYVVLILVVFTLGEAVYTAVIFTYYEASVQDTVLMCLIVLSVAVNAALPASLTLGLLYAQTRLKKLGIFCISPQRINLAGQLNLFCFDKTGTLTEDFLDLHGVVPFSGGSFQDIHFFTTGKTLPWGPLLGAMTSCHSLIMLNGKMLGDPLDVKMFEGTGWEFKSHAAHRTKDGELISCTLVKPAAGAGEDPVEGIAILHQFPFSSSLKRMSVITQIIGERDLTVFVKGAPEVVIELCKPGTVPPNVSEKLDYYTTQGFRVIGLAYRLFMNESLPDLHHIERDMIETDLIFLGLLILENRLKPETISVLQELAAANIRNVMITGDNLQTALNIGTNCGMIPKSSKLILVEANEPQKHVPASITWKTIIQNEENKHKESVLLNGTIFARMTPRQKSSLIEEFQKIDYHVGMCGDGANDCGALKMANVGISLSELEASVASPFTSNIPNIKCVTTLIKEGRNALVSSFTVFKFLTMVTLLALTSFVLLFLKQALLGNIQFTLQDIGIMVVFSLTASLNGPAPKLAPYRPPGQLLSPSLLLSVTLHCLLNIALEVTAFLLLQQQPWINESDVISACQPLNHSTGNVTTTEVASASAASLVTTVFFISSMNYIVLEFVFSKGRPFRKRLHTNYLLSFMMVLQVAVLLFLLFADIESVYTALELACTPYYWRVYILIMGLVHFAVSYAIEEGIIENRSLWLWLKRRSNYQSKSLYRKLQRRSETDTEWPPQNRTDYAIKSVSVTDRDILVIQNASYQPPTAND